MKLTVYNQEAANVGTLELSDAIFDAPMNRDLLHQVITGQLANQRQPLAHTKGRGEVSGGGKKPWQQKGTGRARHGSIRSPIWKGGGVAHGPTKDKIFKKKINKKMARKALSIALSSKVRDHQMTLIDDIVLKNVKTREMAAVARAIAGLFADTKKTKKTLPRMMVVVPTAEKHTALRKAVSNLPTVDIIEARNLNSMAVLDNLHMVFLKDAVGVVEKIVTSK